MIFPEIIQLCDDNLELANVKFRNDFIEEAVKFYVSYLNTEHNTSFLNETIDSVIKSSIQLTEDRTAKVGLSIDSWHCPDESIKDYRQCEETKTRSGFLDKRRI